MRPHPGNFVPVALGLVIIAIGIHIYIRIGGFLDHARETRAVVISVANESVLVRKGRLHPVLQFATADGREVVVQSLEHHNVRPADTLQILYDSRNPQEIEISTMDRAQRRRLLFSGLTVALGLLVGGVGLRQAMLA